MLEHYSHSHIWTSADLSAHNICPATIYICLIHDYHCFTCPGHVGLGTMCPGHCWHGWSMVEHYSCSYIWTPAVMTMSNSGSYPVTPVTLQPYSPTPVAHPYSGHGRADNLPLSTTLGLCSIRPLPHLAIYPALM